MPNWERIKTLTELFNFVTDYHNSECYYCVYNDGTCAHNCHEGLYKWLNRKSTKRDKDKIEELKNPYFDGVKDG